MVAGFSFVVLGRFGGGPSEWGGFKGGVAPFDRRKMERRGIGECEGRGGEEETDGKGVFLSPPFPSHIIER